MLPPKKSDRSDKVAILKPSNYKALTMVKIRRQKQRPEE